MDVCIKSANLILEKWLRSSVSSCSYLYTTGFSLNNALHQVLVARYSEPNLTIDFDNFVSCIMRLESMFSKNLIITCTWSLKYGFLYMYKHWCIIFSFAEIFTVLDADKDGIVELNMLEVCFCPWLNECLCKQVFHAPFTIQWRRTCF